MSSSLVKFARQNQAGNGQPLNWGRADVDGLPYRGVPTPMRDEEFDDRVVRVADYKNDFFDVKIEEQNKRFLEVMDRCANGWYELKFIERFHLGTNAHYLEWVEYYLEDGKPTPAANGALSYAGN